MDFLQCILGGVISIFLQKCYLGGRGGITAGVTVHAMLKPLVRVVVAWTKAIDLAMLKISLQ